MIRRVLRRRESRSFSPWRRVRSPERVLLIRLHAIGDVAVTLPAAKGLRLRYPEATIDALTRAEIVPLLRSFSIFDTVLECPEAAHPADRFALAARLGVQIRDKEYDVIIDLQRNWATRLVRMIASPKAWGEFDRFSSAPASQRVLDTFERSGFDGLSPSFDLPVSSSLREEALEMLQSRGYDGERKLVLLNPAGLWRTRQWPLEHYVALARRWLDREPVRFLLLGTERIREQSRVISGALGCDAINFAGETSLTLAVAMLQMTSAVITEDSGLMHLAWSCGIPVVALFGSSRHIWSAPTGSRVVVFHSGDLPCGQCMEPVCRFGDVHCLARRTPATVLEAAMELASHDVPEVR